VGFEIEGFGRKTENGDIKTRITLNINESELYQWRSRPLKATNNQLNQHLAFFEQPYLAHNESGKMSDVLFLNNLEDDDPSFLSRNLR